MRAARFLVAAVLLVACDGAWACTVDSECDCTEACRLYPPLPNTCVLRIYSSLPPRADGEGCTAGVFTTGNGICAGGRCCAANVGASLVSGGCGDGKSCTYDLCVSGTLTCDNPLTCTPPNECYAGACDPSGACENVYAGDGAYCSAGVCGSGTCQDGCWIGGALHADGSLDSVNPCQRCVVTSDRYGWTPEADGTSCGADEVCAAVTCRTGCFIDDAFRGPGTSKPGEECWICSTSIPLAWTASTGACTGDGLFCTEDRCGGDGVCHHDPIPACVEPGDASLYGCSSGGSGAGLLAVLAPLLLARRRTRAARAASLLALLLLPALAVAAPPKAKGPTPPPAAPAAAPAAEPAPPARRSLPARTEVAVLTFKAGAGVDAKTAVLLTQTFTAAVQARIGKGVLTMEDVRQALGVELQRVMAGCASDDACFAEIGGALGVDLLVTGTLGRVGESMAINVQLLNLRTGQALRRFATSVRSGTEEAFLDAIAPAVEALFPSGGPPPPRFALSLRGELELRSPLAGAGALLFEARLGAPFRAGGGLLLAPNHLGVLGRFAWLPWRAASSLHPVLALEVTAFAADGLAFGVGLNPGLEWSPRRELAVLLELPLQWFVATPDRTRPAYALAALSAAWRF
jgi:TolB-like protein